MWLSGADARLLVAHGRPASNWGTGQYRCVLNAEFPTLRLQIAKHVNARDHTDGGVCFDRRSTRQCVAPNTCNRFLSSTRTIEAFELTSAAPQEKARATMTQAARSKW